MTGGTPRPTRAPRILTGHGAPPPHGQRIVAPVFPGIGPGFASFTWAQREGSPLGSPAGSSILTTTEVMAMLSNEPVTGSTPQPTTAMTNNVIIAPDSATPIVEPAAAEPTEAHTSEAAGPGIEGEQTVWEDHYSFKNFVGRTILGAAFILTWFVLAVTIW